MKHTRTFKGRWFVAALILAVCTAVLLARLVASIWHVAFNPMFAGALAVVVVTAFVSWYYQDANLE